MTYNPAGWSPTERWFPLKEGKIPRSSVHMTHFSKLPKEERTFMPPGQICGDDAFPDVDFPALMGSYANLEEDYPSTNPVDNSYSGDVVQMRKRWSGVEPTVTAIRLRQPNGWSAEWAYGKTFWQIHEGVQSIRKEQADKISERLCHLPEPMQRVGGLSFRSNTGVVRYPYRNGYILCKPDVWHWDEDQKFYLRFERQAIKSHADGQGYDFSIGTYFADLTQKPFREPSIRAFENWLETRDQRVYPLSWMETHAEKALHWLRAKEQKREK